MNIGEKTLSFPIDGLTAWVSLRDYDLLLTIFAGVTEVGECWEAAGPRHPLGYIHLTAKNAQRIRYVHRFVAHLFRGLDLDHTQYECHHLCQNKSCCRPSHLQPLSLSEHRAQTHADGCYRSGDAASWSVLTEAQVVAYRLRYAKGETCSELAEEAGVNKHTLYCALIGVNFGHVPGAVTDLLPIRDNRGEKHKKAVLTDRLIRPIYYAFWGGYMDTVQLAKRYGVSDETIRGVVHDKFWTHVPRPAVKLGRVKIGPRHYRIINRKAA